MRSQAAGIRVIVAMIVLVLGCGDNEKRAAQPDAKIEAVCTQDYSARAPVGCYAAQIFAARDTVALVPTQSEIDRYLERWTRVIDREPILAGRVPQTYRDKPPSQISIMTTNDAVISSWQMQQVTTGDFGFDSAIAMLKPTTINAFFSNPGGPGGAFLFLVDVSRIYNEEELERELALTHSDLPPPFQAPRDDGQWAWISGSTGDLNTAQIDFTFGWGDCFVACDGFRHLQAIVPPTGLATVYDLGGDPLPNGVHLSPTTLPPP